MTGARPTSASSLPPPGGAGVDAGQRAKWERAARACSRWLLEGPCRTADERVLSWCNPRHPGYPYPEIAGYFVSFAADRVRRGRDAACARRAATRVAARLCADVRPSGALGRGATEYAFDTAVGVTGLVDLARATGEDRHRATVARMAAFLERSLDADAAAWRGGRPVRGRARWSLAPGASAAKVALGLDRAAEHLGRPALAERAAARVLAVARRCQEPSGAFATLPGSGAVYAHAHAYAAEGLLYAAHRELLPAAPAGDRLRRAADWLAGFQNSEGGVDGCADATGVVRLDERGKGDATAQAVRIWLAVDPVAYAAPVRRALGFLETLQVPGGGLRYRAKSADVNTWVTLFAEQAFRWAAAGPEPERIL